MIRGLVSVIVITGLVSTGHAADKEKKAREAIGFRQLVATYPVAVQRGTKATVRVRSQLTLDGAYQVFFDRPGIKMTFAETKPIEAPIKSRGGVGTPFKFDVDVPANQDLGVYEFRVATDQAVSSVSHLMVTDYPVIEERSDENGLPAVALAVPVPSAICGTCDKPEDVDCYRFVGKAGEDITCQVYAQRVTHAIHAMQSKGGYLMDSILTLIGPNGQILHQNDNFFGGDSYMHYRLPAAGEYVLEVRDARYIGDEKYVYCVEISNRPYIHTLLPIAVERGKSVDAAIVGDALGDLKQVALKAAADESTGWKTIAVGSSRGPTNPIPYLVSPFPEILAQRGNNSVMTAQTIAIPSGVSGQLLEQDETHYFAFEAAKGKVYRFEIDAQRHGSALDGVLMVFDAKGVKVSETDDDNPQSKDARVFFTAPADGRYYVAVRDLHGRGGERFVYHLQAEPSGPDFEVGGEYYYSMLAPGTRMMWFAKINRLNGFAGPVEIRAEGLPAGVTLLPATIPANMNHCALILNAAPDAKINASLVRITGRGKIPGADGQLVEVVREGRITAEIQSRGGGQIRWPIQTSLVGVTKPLDLLSVTATPAEITLKPGEKVVIKVKITRHPDFTEPVMLAMSFDYFTQKFGEQLPPGVKMTDASKARLTGKTLEGTVVLVADKKATPVDRLAIAVMARVGITFSITTDYASNPIFLTVPAK